MRRYSQGSWRRMRALWGGAAFVATLFAFLPQAGAVPTFARKYNLSCNTCHAPVPKLNPFGEAFRANGYQLPGTLDRTPIWQQSFFNHLAIMPHAMYVLKNTDNHMKIPTPNGIPEGSQLRLNSARGSLEFFSGGTAGPHLSYMSVVELEIEPEVDGELALEDGELEVEEKAGFETEVEWEIEELFAMYNNAITLFDANQGEVNFRAGVFELELPFSQLRSLTSELSPYLAYEASPVKEGFSLGEPQLGASVKGRIGPGECFTDYEIAVVNGTNGGIDTNEAKGVYLRNAWTVFDRLRIGGLLFLGRQNIGSASNLDDEDDDFWRVGADARYILPGEAEIFAQWLHGKDSDVDGALVGSQEFQYDAFFVGFDFPLRTLTGDFPILKDTWFIARYDWLKAWDQVRLGDARDRTLVANSGDEDTIQRVTVNLRYYFQPNTFFLVEYGYQDNSLGYPPLDLILGGEGSGEAGAVVDVDSHWVMFMFAMAF